MTRVPFLCWRVMLLLAQLVDLPFPIVAAIWFGIPVILGTIWLLWIVKRRRFGLAELFWLVTYWGILISLIMLAYFKGK